MICEPAEAGVQGGDGAAGDTSRPVQLAVVVVAVAVRSTNLGRDDEMTMSLQAQ